MNLKDLRNLVAELPADLDDCELVLQIDPEGNGYYCVRGIDAECVAENDVKKDGHVEGVYSLGNTADNNCMEGEALKKDKSKRILVVFP